MRHHLYLILVVLLQLPGFGQTIDRIEYFFDTDPGYGSATPISFSPGSSVTAAFNINTDGLSTGPHSLLIRAKNIDGKWSNVSQAVIYVQDQQAGSQVVKLEYYIDDDPGIGNATDIPVTPGNLGPAYFEVNTTGLSKGLHYLCVRAKDNMSRWGILSSSMFMLEYLSEIDISRIEYFIDTDPGFGQATQVTVALSQKVNTVFTISMTGLSEGIHYLCVRAKNASGTWSNLQQGLFCKVPEEKYRITDMEYFIDDDPGFGNGIPVSIDTAHSIVADFIPDTVALDIGSHNLSVRVRDEAGNWSILQDTSFMHGHLLRTWTGALSDDWNTAGNWAPEGVPIWNDIVVIPFPAPLMPVISTPGLSCFKMVVSEGAELIINPGIILTVTGM